MKVSAWVIATTFAITPPVLAQPPPDQLSARAAVAKIKDAAFCPALGKALRAPTVENMHYRAAMVERAMKSEDVTSTMMLGIKTREPVIGMNVCAVVAALGRPERSNRSVGKWGEHHQLVYTRSGRDLYVYLDNYVVTSWQD